MPIFLHKPEIKGCRTAQLHSRLLQLYESWVRKKGPQSFLIMLSGVWLVCVQTIHEVPRVLSMTM